MGNSNVWVPLAQQLIWPVFIILLLFVFRDKVNGLYTMATEGRSVEIAGWLKIGEKVKETEIRDFGSGDLSIEAIEGDEIAIEKGGEDLLNSLQDKIRTSEIKSIDILKITNNKTYYKDLLLKYIGTLGINQIVFIKNEEFDGWISSSVFSSQLLTTNSQYFQYEELKNLLVGVKSNSVPPDMKTSAVLNQMIEEKTDQVAVVEGAKFKYIINKQDILTAVVANTILAKSGGS